MPCCSIPGHHTPIERSGVSWAKNMGSIDNAGSPTLWKDKIG
jgi:hypothetical protein